MNYLVGVSKPPKKSTLKEQNPDLASQWHPTKNGNLQADDVAPLSNKKVWWKCEEGQDHEWEAKISSRNHFGLGCPICSNRKIVESNCLATTHPELAAEWHPEKNGEMTPRTVGAGSNKYAWWKCQKGPDHEWRVKTVSRTHFDSGCPYCNGKKVSVTNSLQALNPDLAAEWHPERNGTATAADVTEKSAKPVWWQCSVDSTHEWKTSPALRVTQGTGCPVCANKVISSSNSLATTHPELAAQWHPTKNGNLTPDDVGAGSTRRVWWKCPEGPDHEWSTTLENRAAKGRNCPICSNQKVVQSNCLATVNPALASEWHPTKNGNLTAQQVLPGGKNKVWWQCPKNPTHEWQTAVSTRLRSGCPFCTLTPQSMQELTITFELKHVFKDIDPKGYKTRVDGKLMSVDIYIPSLSLAVEFDGSYWHKGKRELDLVKTLKLEGQGLDVLRIREEPLQKVQDFDIVSPLKWQPKLVADRCLQFIKQRYELPGAKAEKIDAYLQQEKLKGERMRDRYIDAVLEEKASRAK